MKNFVLIGAAGYIAPRHMKAIKETGNNLIAALDPHDAVGVLDQYFPDCDFFTEFERFDRHCEKLKRQGTAIDYVVVCSPNYLHDAHIRFGLRIGADVICEKPVVLNPWNLDALIEMEKETGRKVYVVHQLRYHPEIIKLRQKVLNGPADKIYEVDLKYITPRGKWYQYSWKGDEEKSGGLLSNIGIHIFDMLTWIFGNIKNHKGEGNNKSEISGLLKLERANVKWLLGIGMVEREKGEREVTNALRTLLVNDETIDFTKGTDELHTAVYSDIVRNNMGVSLEGAFSTISLVYNLRKQLA